MDVSCKLFLWADNKKKNWGMRVQSKEWSKGMLSGQVVWVVCVWRLQGTRRSLPNEGSPEWCNGELDLLSAFFSVF